MAKIFFMIKKLAGEAWKPLLFSGWNQLRNRYAVSNMGRIASYKKDAIKDGKLLSGSLTTGYRTLNLHRPGNEDEHDYVINETAATEFKMHQPLIGQRFIWGGDTGQVIGVVKDFHFKSMHDKIGPMVLSKNQGTDSYIFIKTAAGSTPRALGAAEAVWAKFIPDEPFDYRFLDDSFNTLYQTDLKTSELMIIFSVIAIIISGLGLFGLSAFTAGQRTKEIGIRKVLGATVQQIATLLSKEFISLVLVAIIIATPIAWWVMNKWLEGFAYRIDISLGIFLSAGILALSVAIFSVSYQAIKAAVANPARSLRTE